MNISVSRILVLCALVSTGLMTNGCEKLRVEPVKVSGEAIVGHWYAEQNHSDDSIHARRRVYLQIRDDGFVRYYNLLCETDQQSQMTRRRSLELDYTPLKRLNHKKMLLQRYPLTPQFELTIGQWPDGSRIGPSVAVNAEGLDDTTSGDQFEVDNVLLQRIQESEIPAFQQWQCG
ncbi:MAG: hypothetical protein WBA20_04870 [Ketobacter sp.]